MDAQGQPVAGAVVDVAKDFLSGSLDLRLIPAGALAPFTLQVQTLAANQLDSAYSSGMPVIEQLARPSAVTLVLDQLADNLTVGWQPVTNAVSYSIDLVKVDDRR